MSSSAAAAPLLRVRHASKSYDGEAALIDAWLDLRAGEVHALMGENGAGKSTLIKLLAGVETPDTLVLEIDGQPVDVRAPADAARLGFRFIHQELNVVPALSVAENIFLGHPYPRTPLGTIAWKRLRSEARRALESLGVNHIDPGLPMSRLDTGDAMLASIARAFVEPANGGEPGRVYVMDEPTAALSRRETELLFAVVRRLRAGGAGVLYVSHRMEEIFELADRVTVLRDGRWVSTVEMADATRESLILAMTGRTLAAASTGGRAAGGRVVGGRGAEGEDIDPSSPAFGANVGDRGKAGVTAAPEADHATTDRHAAYALEAHDLRTAALHGVSLSLQAGEVVGVTGLSGSGRSELLRALIGADRLTGGTIRLAGHEVRLPDPAAAWQAGLAYVPEERRSQALAMNADVRRNVLLPHLARVTRTGFVSRPLERRETERWSRQVGLRARGSWQSVHELSGGNQQKVVLARALAAEPKVLLLDEPTRGVDVGAKADIYGLIRDAAADGAAVLLASSDLDEVLATCDRVLVLHTGRLVFERQTASLDRTSLLELCYGGVAA